MLLGYLQYLQWTGWWNVANIIQVLVYICHEISIYNSQQYCIDFTELELDFFGYTY